MRRTAYANVCRDVLRYGSVARDTNPLRMTRATIWGDCTLACQWPPYSTLRVSSVIVDRLATPWIAQRYFPLRPAHVRGPR
jgi:hypothetical protein